MMSKLLGECTCGRGGKGGGGLDCFIDRRGRHPASKQERERESGAAAG